MALLKNKFRYSYFLSLPLLLTSCIFSFGDNDEWKKEYGTPELLLENARDESYVYLYEDQNQHKDVDNIIQEAIKKVAPFRENESSAAPDEMRYFTYEASWVPATSGPNFEHLSIWQNGFVRIDHKTSLGPHKYLYFSIDETKAAQLVDFVFSMVESAK